MTKLRTMKNSAILRTLTPLRPQLRCATRWTGTFTMVQRFLEINEFIEEMAEEDFAIEELLLNSREMKEIEILNEELTLLSSVMTRLQVI